MEVNAEEIIQWVKRKSRLYETVSDRIWEFAEIRFKEYQSKKIQMDLLAEEGFRITDKIAGMETAFMAEWGSGGPLIGILGEFDALPNLSQICDLDHCQALDGQLFGHGCGHHLLGTAAVEAAAAVKEFLQNKKIAGRIRYYATPAEEGASGKTFMLREGCFTDLDICLSWHPDSAYSCGGSTLSSIRTYFNFYGQSAHAAFSPELGRSALDAVELMDVGCNYLREHVIPEARIHYAITNSGGTAPNTVQAEAEVCYNVRAPKNGQVLDILRRIEKVAQGASLMTETTFTSRPVSYYANFLDIAVLNQMVYKIMNQTLDLNYSEEELEYARKFRAAAPESGVKTAREEALLYGRTEEEKDPEYPVSRYIRPVGMPKAVSADLGNVSWNVPTAYFCSVCYAAGTPLHSWQAVAQGKSALAHRGMRNAAVILALTAAQLFETPSIITQAKKELLEIRGSEKYECILPADVTAGSF